MPLLEVRDISKSYHVSGKRAIDPGSGAPVEIGGTPVTQPVSPGGRGRSVRVLENVGFELDSGGALGIIGASGAGKSTLALLLAGLEQPDSGTIRIGDIVVSKECDRRALARRSQLVWQDARGSLDPRLCAWKAVAEPLQIHGFSGDIRSRATELLEEVGLGREFAGRYPHELSGGEVQRVVIARALAVDPQLLVCDEPASALDTLNKRLIVELLVRLRQERDLAVLVISHDLQVVSALAERLLVLRRGKVVEQGEAEKLLVRPVHPYTRELVDSVPRL